jgi:hypothetical protein
MSLRTFSNILYFIGYHFCFWIVFFCKKTAYHVFHFISRCWWTKVAHLCIWSSWLPILHRSNGSLNFPSFTHCVRWSHKYLDSKCASAHMPVYLYTCIFSIQWYRDCRDCILHLCMLYLLLESTSVPLFPVLRKFSVIKWKYSSNFWCNT